MSFDYFPVILLLGDTTNLPVTMVARVATAWLDFRDYLADNIEPIPIITDAPQLEQYVATFENSITDSIEATTHSVCSRPTSNRSFGRNAKQSSGPIGIPPEHLPIVSSPQN